MRKIQQQEPQKVFIVWTRLVSGQLNATQKEDKARAKIPRNYQEFYAMFKKKAHEKLPEHRDWDHKIPIEEGKKPTYGPINALSETELKTLREYLNENLKKGFIRLSTSPARYPILFVPKKDRKLRLCVNYRQLKAITVKNWYLFFDTRCRWYCNCKTWFKEANSLQHLILGERLIWYKWRKVKNGRQLFKWDTGSTNIL